MNNKNNESTMSESKFNWLRTLIIGFVAGGILSLSVIFVDKHFSRNTNYTYEYNFEICRSRVELAYNGCKDRIVEEIDSYIDSVAPYSMLNGLKLFELCDEYDVDVRFAMAQGQAESHFGTTGVAAKTNMVWNVRAYDGKSAEQIKATESKDYHPDHPDFSIEPYLKLLTNNYLVDGKTEQDMFISFTDKNGKRYASYDNYESLVLSIYEKINKSTELDSLLKEFKKYKIILGK